MSGDVGMFAGTNWAEVAFGGVDYVLPRSDSMSSGWHATLETLRRSENDFAVVVLRAAVKDRLGPMARDAFDALLERRCQATADEALARWHELPYDWREVAGRHMAAIGGALRKALRSEDPQVFERACQCCVDVDDFDALHLLTEIAETQDDPRRAHALAAILALADRIQERSEAPRDYNDRRDPQAQRQHAATTLELSAARYAKHRLDGLVEAFLTVAARDNATIRQAMQSAADPLRAPIERVLASSQRIGVHRLLWGFLEVHAAPLAMIERAVARSDDECLGGLCREWVEPSPLAQTNAKRLTRLPWLAELSSRLVRLDEQEQTGLVRLVAATGVSDDDKQAFFERMIAAGEPAARAVAVDAMAPLSGPAADATVAALVDDSDPRVAAAALRQLRTRETPGALAAVLARANSPHEIVREAARESLAEFTFPRYLAAFETLSPAARRSTGEIVRRVDSDVVGQVALELEAAGRTRRLRALAIVDALDLVDPLDETIAALTLDEDHVVRRAAVERLARCATPTALAAVQRCAGDASVEVRRVAEAALKGALSPRDPGITVTAVRPGTPGRASVGRSDGEDAR